MYILWVISQLSDFAHFRTSDTIKESEVDYPSIKNSKVEVD